MYVIRKKIPQTLQHKYYLDRGYEYYYWKRGWYLDRVEGYDSISACQKVIRRNGFEGQVEIVRYEIQEKEVVAA